MLWMAGSGCGQTVCGWSGGALAEHDLGALDCDVLGRQRPRRRARLHRTVGDAVAAAVARALDEAVGDLVDLATEMRARRAETLERAGNGLRDDDLLVGEDHPAAHGDLRRAGQRVGGAATRTTGTAGCTGGTTPAVTAATATTGTSGTRTRPGRATGRRTETGGHDGTGHRDIAHQLSSTQLVVHGVPQLLRLMSGHDRAKYPGPVVCPRFAPGYPRWISGYTK